jgi:hypothetical protein
LKAVEKETEEGLVRYSDLIGKREIVMTRFSCTASSSFW